MNRNGYDDVLLENRGRSYLSAITNHVIPTLNFVSVIIEVQ